jgi:putative lipoprotein
MFNWKSISLFIAVLALTGCVQLGQSEADAQQAQVSNVQETVNGEVWYRERIALPEHAKLIITLEDIVRQDIVADVIATEMLVLDNQQPWVFTLNYDAAKITEKGRYVLRARIEVDGQLKFINTTSIPAFNNSDKPVRIMVSSVAQESAPVAMAELENTYWKLDSLNGKTIKTAAQQTQVHFVLHAQESKVVGFSGCNKFFGQYTVDVKTNAFKFSPLMSTQMACINEDFNEHDFLTELSKTTKYKVNGQTLNFFTAEGKVLVSFSAVYLY